MKEEASVSFHCVFNKDIIFFLCSGCIFMQLINILHKTLNNWPPFDASSHFSLCISASLSFYPLHHFSSSFNNNNIKLRHKISAFVSAYPVFHGSLVEEIRCENQSRLYL